MILGNVNFSKKQLIIFIGIVFVLLAIPLTVVFLQQTQIIRQNALQPTAVCIPTNGSIPGGYSYTPGSLEIYVHVVETNGAIGLIPGVFIRAVKKGNNLGTGANAPRNFADGPGCGFSKEGTTGSDGHVNLEPLNCAHNNFEVFILSGIPSDVEFDSTRSTFQPDGNNQTRLLPNPDIHNLALENGYAGILKLYYKRKPSAVPTNTPTPTPTGIPGATPAPTTPPGVTPLVCPVPNTVTNVHIDCPYCP